MGKHFESNLITCITFSISGALLFITVLVSISLISSKNFLRREPSLTSKIPKVEDGETKTRHLTLAHIRLYTITFSSQQWKV